MALGPPGPQAFSLGEDGSDVRSPLVRAPKETEIVAIEVDLMSALIEAEGFFFGIQLLGIG